MKKKIVTQITIEAPVDDVWKIFTDFDSYPQWSPTLRNFSKNPTVGEKVKIRLEQPEGPKMTMNPVILERVENQILRWRGQLFFSGLFDGEHYFILEKLNDHHTRFIQGEDFSGILVALLKKMIDGPTLNGFNQFNEALKKRVEETYKY